MLHAVRHLGIDLGDKRVGLALSDEDGTFASPHEVLERTGDRAVIARVAQIARSHDVRVCVVGLPLHMDGREGPEAERARRFAARLSEKIRRPVELWDERWSTIAAERSRREAGPRRRRHPVDAVAAALLLQGFLDAKGGGCHSDPHG
jgi:putative Holliday junction resolvase